MWAFVEAGAADGLLQRLRAEVRRRLGSLNALDVASVVLSLAPGDDNDGFIREA